MIQRKARNVRPLGEQVIPVSHLVIELLCMYHFMSLSRLLNYDVSCSFGGTDGQYHYNDTWAFDLNTRKWSELQCIGFIPSPREGHAAALVDDVVYIFGGRGVDGKDLGDLAAFKISSQYSVLRTVY